MSPGFSEASHTCLSCRLLRSRGTGRTSLTCQARRWVTVIKALSQCQVYQIESQTAPRAPTKAPDINQRAIFQGRWHGRTGHLSLFSVPATVAHVEGNYSWWCRVRVRMARAAPGDGVNAGGDGHPCLEIQTTSCRLHLLPESQGITEKYFPFEVLSPRIYIKCPLSLSPAAAYESVLPPYIPARGRGLRRYS